MEVYINNNNSLLYVQKCFHDTNFHKKQNMLEEKRNNERFTKRTGIDVLLL